MRVNRIILVLSAIAIGCVGFVIIDKVLSLQRENRDLRPNQLPPANSDDRVDSLGGPWPTSANELRPVESPSDGFVASAACRSCHPSQYESWHASYHRTMTQVASPKSVIGRFDGATVQYQRLTASFHRKGDEFWVHLDDPDALVGKDEQQVVLTTGFHHMQVYWVSAGQPRKLAVVPFMYLREDERWIPRDAAFLKPPNTPPSIESGRWNTTCIRCHTTHGVPGFQEPSPGFDEGRFDSRVAEFGISCEACHGPGEAHVRFHNDANDAAGEAPMVHPDRLSHLRSSQVCGRCHSVGGPNDMNHFLVHGIEYRPGDDLAKKATIVNDPQMESSFWSDGMIRVSGREYNGLTASPCFKRGELSCMSCHVMHKPQDDARTQEQWANDQLDLGMDGNQACMQCHTKFDQAQSLRAHTHHAADSPGSLCYNCHMPHTTWGLLKAIRSHQIDSPDVKVAIKVGRPDACNLCHLDKTLPWTAGHLEKWYDVSPPSPQKFSDSQRSTSAALSWLLSGDAGQRALLAWHLGWPAAHDASGGDWLAPFLAQLLEDPYHAVRYVAQRSLRRLRGFEDFDYDFMGGTQHRADARRRAVELWNKTPRTSRPSVDSILNSILFDEQGRLRGVKDSSLHERGRRWNRPVDLAE